MKKLAILFMLALPYFGFSQSKFKFEESGREFSLTTDGEFEFSFLSGDKIVRDFEGNATKIGSIRIQYNWEGLPTKVGDIRIEYNYNSQPSKIGGLSIFYDYAGRVERTSGSVHQY